MKKKSIIRQGIARLLKMRAFGQSKHLDKLKNNGQPARNKIYSGSTLTGYIPACCRFLRWARKEHGCNDLDVARQYVGTYLRLRILVTADLELIKSRFAQRMRGNLPAPVAAMLEKKHSCFDSEPHDIHVISGETDLDTVVAQIAAK